MSKANELRLIDLNLWKTRMTGVVCEQVISHRRAYNIYYEQRNVF